MPILRQLSYLMGNNERKAIVMMDVDLNTIHLRDHIRCDFPWADRRMNAPIFQEQTFVGKPKGRGEIVQGHHRANGVFLDHPADQFQDFDLIFQVQAAGRFIQKQ